MTRKTCPRHTPPIALFLGLVGAGLGCDGHLMGVTPTGDPGVQAGGAAAPEPAPAAVGECAPLPRRVMKLTPVQYERTVRQLIPDVDGLADSLRKNVAGASRFSGAADQLDLTLPYLEALLQLTNDLAARALTLPVVSACLGTGDVACLDAFMEGFASRALRRPLDPAELERYWGFQRSEAAIDGSAQSLRQFFRAVLLSPDFLFRTEFGPEAATAGPVTLTQFERASALSYLVTDAPPDDELLGAAQQGGLETSEQLLAHASRLLAQKGAAGVVRFFAELMETRRVLDVAKDEALFPDLTPTIRADMVRETEAFVTAVLWQGEGTFASLLLEPRSAINVNLATYYGVPAPPTDFELAELPGQGRAGLLTQGSLMTTLADKGESHIIRRGKFVREVLLCEALPSPPLTAVNDFPAVDPSQPQVARLAQHRSNPACASCHEFMDPIGMAFEHFDAAGRYRTHDRGVGIDPSGYIKPTSSAAAVHFADTAAMASILATMPEVQSCFESFAWEYALGVGDCTPSIPSASPSPLQVRELFARIASSESFVSRQ